MTMKYYLFLLSVLSVVYLSKAGPLRLQKRAAFYIANETACVVDNIVYSSGDPIPTDDPCEACKCRPPGFACVLKECKIKPGCRAVRHVGHCCPEYVCGCEHNGRWYSDGEQIVDERNPCYECHCLGTSIACAFADCNFRLDCVPVYVPGKCCPDYTNCSRDNPEITSVIGDNALPPANLLPELYESGLPGVFSADEVAETTEQSQTSTETPEPSKSEDTPIVEETGSDPKIEEISPGIEDSGKDIPDEKEEPKEYNLEKKDEEPQVLFNSETELKKEEEIEVTTVKEVLENKAEVTESEDKAEVKEFLEDKAEVKEILEDKTGVTEAVKVIEDKATESTVSKSEVSDESVPELREEEPSITTEIDKVVESEAEESTERHVETAVTSTTVPTEEISVKNSAAQNSKSLKLLEDQTSEELIEKIELTKESESSQKTDDKTEVVASVSTEELPSKVESDDATVPTKIEPEVEENIAEESSNDHPAIALYSNDDKVIKKESAETVTIVVHVREKSKPPTETDFETEEKVTKVYLTSKQPEEIAAKSNDNIKAEIITESAKADEVTSTGKNFEVFPGSTEINTVELTTSSSKDPEETIEARSEPDSEGLDTEAKPTNEDDPDSKSKIDSPVTETTLIVNEEVSEINNEAREDEIIEEIKDQAEVSDDLKVTEKPEEETKVTEIFEEQKTTEKPQKELKVTKITIEQPDIALKIKIITDSEEETEAKSDIDIAEKPEAKLDIGVAKETEAKSDIDIAEEVKSDIEEPKLEENVESKSEDSIEEAKQKNSEVKEEEPKVDKLEEVETNETTDTEPEVRSIEDEPEESKSEEIKETKLDENVETAKLEEKQSTPEETVEESKSEKKIDEPKEEEKIEVTNVENKNSETEQEDQKSEETKDQESEESNQPEEPKNSE